MATFFEWLKSTLGNLPKRESSSTRPRQDTFPRVYDSQLEDRRVLNAGAVVSAIDLVSLQFDAGQAANDGVADAFELTRLDSSHITNQVAVSINNHRVWQGNAAELQSIRFDGSSDSDQFYIDPTIQVPAGIFIDGMGVAGGSLPRGASDVIVFAASSGGPFDEITYQSSGSHTQVRFVQNADALNSLIQVQNVESMRDLNLALERKFATGASASSGGNYSLQDSDAPNTTSVNKTVKWSSENTQIDFTAPSNRLTIDLRSATDLISTAAFQDSLLIDTVDLKGVEQIDVFGDTLDTVRLKGDLSVGRDASIHAANIRADGNISTASGGSVRLDAGAGVLTVNGAVVSRGDDWHRGGDVVLAGDHVLLQGLARIDVSGGTGGGQIRVGGGYQGKDLSIRNSQYTYVSTNAALNADARITGNGGKVFVWSDNTSIVDGSGNIVARGGINGGDGGFIETSGKRYIKIDGAANAYAYQGQAGTWLIDPDDVEIVAVAGAAANTTYILTSTIATALTTGNFSIVTSNPSGGSGDIRVVVALNLSPTSSRTLTLDATRDILFQSGVTGNANLNLILTAGRDIDSTAVTIGQLDSLTINAARNISVGTINLSGGSLTATVDSDNDDVNAIFQSTGALSASNFSFNGSTTGDDSASFGSTVTSTSAAIQFSKIDNLSFQEDVSANTNITFSSITGPLTLASDVDIIANGPVNFSSITSGIVLAGSTNSTNILFVNGNASSITLGNVTASNSVNLSLSSSNGISVGSISIQDGDLTVAFDIDNNSTSTFQSSGDLTAGSISITGSLSGNDDVSLGAELQSTAGSILFSKVDDVSLQRDVSSQANITFTNVQGQLILGSDVDVTSNSGTLDFTTFASNILLNGSNGSTNIITANSTTGSIKLAAVTASSSSVSLTLNSATDVDADDINIQTGSLTVNYSGQDVASANVATFNKVTAGTMMVSGSSRTDDQTVFTDTLTIGSGGLTANDFGDLLIEAAIASDGNITTTGISGSKTHLIANITSNGGNIAMMGGTLLINGGAARTIASGGGAVATGGNVALGAVDGESSAANLTINSKGTATGGTVSVGTVTAGTTGLNRLSIQTNATTSSGQVTLSSTRLVAKAGTASSLIVASNSTTILANGIIDLSSSSNTDGGSIDFGSSQLAPTSASSTVTLNTSNTSSSGGDGGNIQLGGVSNNGANYFDSVLIDTSAANGAKTNGDLDFSGATNPEIAVVGTSGTGITLTGTIVKGFSGILSFLTNRTGTAASSSSIDVTEAYFSTTAGLKFDTSGGGVSTDAGDVKLGDIGVSAADRPISLVVDTRGTSTSGDLLLDDGSGTSTELHVNGNLDLTNAKIKLTDNALLRTYGTSIMAIGDVATSTAVARNLTLNSDANISVSAISLTGGTLTIAVDVDDDQTGAMFQSSDSISAGSVTITGTSANDEVTLGGSITSAGTIKFTSLNKLTLGSSVDVTSNSGSLDFTTIASGILLGGTNGSTNIITANSTTGSIKLAAVTATNSTVSLSLNSATDVDADDINIQTGSLTVNYSGQNVASANVATFTKVTAGTMTVSGSSRTDDQTVFTDTLTIGFGGLTANDFADLSINAAITSGGNITTTGISGSKTHLIANITSNGGNIAMTGGTLLINGGTARTIASGGGAVATGGNVTLGAVDGENGPANLTINSKGTSTGGAVSIGAVTAGTAGLNRLDIQTDSSTPGLVTLSSTRLVAKGSTAATLVVDSDGTTILANGTIDLSSNNSTDGGSIDFGSSTVAPSVASSALTLRTSNSSLSGGDGGDIKLGGIANNGVNYFDSVLIDTSAANVSKANGDLDFSNTASPTIAVDGTAGTGISLIGTIVKAFSGVLSFLTNPNGASANSSSIDVSKADFQSTAGLAFDTSNSGDSTNAGDVVLGDIGVLAANRPNFLSADTRGSFTSGDLLLDDGTGTSTELHVNGDLNLTNAKIKLTDNAVLRTYGTGNMTLGDVATSTAVARNLTLNSEANIAVSAIDLTGGTLSASVDSNDDNVGSTFVSSGALAAGSFSILGSATRNDDISIGSTLNTTSTGISFSQISNLAFIGDVTAATNVTFTNVTGELSLGLNVDVTANNGPLDFSAIASGLRLVGSNGTTSILTASGATGSLFLGSVLANNPSVALTLRSTANTSVGSVDLQDGALSSSIDTDNNNIGATFQTTGTLRAGTVTISGSSTVNDDIIFGSTVTTTNGAIHVIRFDDLRINGDWTSAGGVTTSGINVSRTQLAANIISNGGNISMTDGTLLIDGTSLRQIKSGGAAVNAVNGGSVTLGTIDGEVSTADLEVDSRGTNTSGSVTLGDVTAASGNTGLNRLRIFTAGPTPGQVSLSNIRLIAKSGVAASLGISSGGNVILADGTINLSSSVNGQAGGNVDFGSSVVAPRNANSTLTINTSNTNATSGADGSDGGDVLLGGIGVNSTAASFFDSVTLDLSAADILDSAGTLRFGGVTAPSIQVDGVSGTGIQIVGRVDNSAGGTLSMLTSLPGAIQNTTAIDLTQASFIGTGGLIFDTSGGSSALHSGSISLGDIGLIVRPVSLVVDTRGTMSSGHLILYDGVVGSPVEIRIDGTIDLSSASVDLLDDASLESHNDGNSISLGLTTASGGARNLQLASDSGITVSSINLSGGNLQANVDVNNNEIGATFRSNGTISSNGFAITGSAANDDIASVGAAVTTTGAVSFSNLDQLRIQGVVSAVTTFNATNIVGAVDFSGISGVVANGSIDLLNTVSEIRLSGIAGNITLIEAKGNASVVTLSAVTAINPGTRLNVRSDYSADLRNVDMNTGTLDVQLGRSTTLTDAAAHLRGVVAGGLIIRGTSTSNDSAVLSGLLDIGTGGISIQNLANLDVNFNVRSEGDISANSIRNRIQVAEAVSIQSSLGIDLQTNVALIQLPGINGLTNQINADGDNSTLKLASIQALQNVNLLIISANNINIESIDATGSTLSIDVDNNNNTANSQLDAGQVQAKQITVGGGSDRDDNANFAGLVESKSGSLSVNSFNTVNLSAGILIKASNGDVNLNNHVNEIRFVGGTGTSSSIQSANGSLFVSALTESNTSDLIDLRADRDISLLSSSLNSRLQVVAGDHNSNIGTINSSGTLLAGSISFEAATGIGTNSAVATSTIDLSAVNRLGGLLQIANNKTGTVTVASLVANQGGNIRFTQSGGGVVRFQGVASNPDGTPAANESDIRLSNIGCDLVVEGTGVTAGGLGKVTLETLGSGDIQLVTATRASGSAVEVQSARRIIGSGTLQGLAVDLNAQTGIGTTGSIQTQTTQLSASTLLNSVDVQNSSAALTTVSKLVSGGFGTVQFKQVGGGDAAISNVATGVAFSNAGSDIRLQNDNGSVLIQGSVDAGGGGAIRMDAQNNLVLDAGAFVKTNGVNATIKGNAGGQFQFNPGATIRAGSSDANTEAVVTRIPPLVSARPSINSLGVNVDSLGLATIQIQLGGANPALIDRNFSIVVDWGDNEIDNFPNGSISPLTINPQISRFDASGVVYAITHQYQGNPNPADPIADIPIKVTVGIDALNRIQFNESQVPVTSLTQVVNERFVVPAAGLFTLRFDLPQTATLQGRIVFNNSASVQTVNAVAPPISSPEIVVSSGGSAVEKSRSYVLRVITLVSEQGEISASEDIELTDQDIAELSSGELFLKLGDNRYRIYLIREDGNELLLKDFYLRNHRPVEVDDSAATPNSPPTDERVLDRDLGSIFSLNTGLAAISDGEPEVIPPDVELEEPDEMSNEAKGEEKPITNATLAAGTVVQTMRSWRKAARRFRAG